MRALMALLLVSPALAGCLAGQVDDQGLNAAGIGAGGFSHTTVYPGEYDLDGDFSKPLLEGVHDILEPEVVTLQSEVDGADVQIGYFLPDVPEGQKVPVIVYASPYLFTGMTPEGLKDHYIHTMLVENYVPHGYAVAAVPIRGTADNGGCMDLMGPAERADLDQAITWLGEAEWSNGAIGMVGASYDGSTPWMVAAKGNPYLKTIVPVSGVPDWFTLMYHNGTHEARGALLLNYIYYQFGFRQYNAIDGTRSAEHMVEGAVCPESWEGFGAAAYSFQTGERDPLGFWAERDSRPGVEENYNGSILLVQGLVDWNVEPHNAYPWVNELEDRGLTVKHLLGQWGHAFPDWGRENGKVKHYRMDWAEIQLRWYDYWLKGDKSADLGPRVQVQDSEGHWRNEDAWPPADATPTTLHLNPDGELATDAASRTDTTLVGPRGDSATVIRADEFFHNNGLDTCKACAAFATPAFEKDFRFAGIPQVHVTVTPTGPGGHLSAWLYAVDGDARERIGWGSIDLRFAEGGEQAKAVTPGEPLVARMVLEPLDAVVPAGSHLELVLHQASYGDHMESTPTYPVQVHTGDGQSTLTVLTFDRDADAFFEPPSA